MNAILRDVLHDQPILKSLTSLFYLVTCINSMFTLLLLLLFSIHYQLKFRPQSRSVYWCSFDGILSHVIIFHFQTTLLKLFIIHPFHVCSISTSMFLSIFYDPTPAQTNLLWPLYLGNGNSPMHCGDDGARGKWAVFWNLTEGDVEGVQTRAKGFFLVASAQTILQLALLNIFLL
jgi:hypothetical protein